MFGAPELITCLLASTIKNRLDFLRCLRVAESNKSLGAALGLAVAGLLVGGSFAGCSSKAITPPRSELVAESQRTATPLPNPEDDRARYMQFEQRQRSKLINLIRQRTAAGDRDPSYKIGPGDEVEINVFDVPELNLTARVKDSGFINLPLVGGVTAAGNTEQELIDELTNRLSGFVRHPQVSVFISQYGSQKVAVVGAVEKPGNYSLKKGSNGILELLAEAGGVNSRAGNYLNVVPSGDSAYGVPGADSSSGSGKSSGVDMRARAGLAQMVAGGNSTNGRGVEISLDTILGTSGGIPIEVPIRGGDMIVVPEAGTVTVEGEVQKPGAFDLGRKSSLLGALAASGGITYGAKVDEVEVVRDLGNEDKVHLILDLNQVISGEVRDIKLRNGDVVRVPSDSDRRMRQDTFEAIGKVINVGVGGTVNVVH